MLATKKKIASPWKSSKSLRMAAYVPAAPVAELTALNDIHDYASKSAIPPPVRLVHLGHDISDCASKVRVYLQTGEIHAGYLGMSGDGPVRRQDQHVNGRNENRANC
jgi:hypothetical protein